ncbi:hypothetical protein B0H13DRAFT_95808 [Mycena leptocephala]|nr:hypothetical protein B0H13DRAFT_95808 [Mycena leptocephala]
MSFLVPSAVPQDLLLIHDLMGVPEPVPLKPPPKSEDDIDSSDSESENGSEDEIKVDLIKVEEEDSKHWTAYDTTESMHPYLTS